MSKEQILIFIKWLGDHDMQIAGWTPNVFLGTEQLRPLHEDDYEKMIADFLESQA